MERVFDVPFCEIKAYRTGSLAAITWLDASMVLIDTGGNSFGKAEAESIISNAEWHSLLCPENIANKIDIPGTERDDRLLLSVTPASLLPAADHEARILERKADFLGLVRLYRAIDTMADDLPDDDDDAAEWFMGRKRPFMAAGAFCSGRLVSAAYISTGTLRNAMIAGVATDEAFRNRGYASAAVSGLCREAFRLGMERLSLWPEEKAEHLYRALGFRDDGWYTMLRRKRL